MLDHNLIDHLASAEAFLLQAQSPGGVWRDFALQPGAGEAWTTSWVAFALAEMPVRVESIAPLKRTANALHALGSTYGWAYNRQAAVDADSTAWSILFLAQVGDLRAVDAVGVLSRFLDTGGAAHTFCGSRFGSWADAHADVTPAVGLALVAAGAPQVLIERVRAACLASLDEDPPWTAFWWTTHAYAVARSLHFLEMSGGVPSPAKTCVTSWLDRQSAPECAFDAAQRLITAIRVGAYLPAMKLVAELLTTQQPRGAWASKPILLVPFQEPTNADRLPQAHADDYCLFTTAAVLMALKLAVQRLDGLAEP